MRMLNEFQKYIYLASVRQFAPLAGVGPDRQSSDIVTNIIKAFNSYLLFRFE